MTLFLFANNATTTLAGPITSTATSATLASGTGTLFPHPLSGQQFAMTFSNSAGTQREIVYVTAINGDVITMTRGEEGTVQQAWNAGDVAASLLTAGCMAAMEQTSQVQNYFRNLQVYSSPGSYTFTVPAGVTEIYAIVTGGGGGGSQCAGTNPSADMSGAGGGAAGTSIGIYPVVPGESLPVTVGYGGATQQNGASSSLGSLVGATGGQGSSFQGAATSAGGAPGYGYGGQMNLAGGYGSDGQSGSLIFPGNGGASYWGGGGRASVLGQNQNGQMNGQAPGSGGGGAYNSNSASGGSGANGIVMIRY